MTLVTNNGSHFLFRNITDSLSVVDIVYDKRVDDGGRTVMWNWGLSPFPHAKVSN